MCVGVHVCGCACVWVCMRRCVGVHAHVCGCARVWVCMCVGVHVCGCAEKTYQNCSDKCAHL